MTLNLTHTYARRALTFNHCAPRGRLSSIFNTQVSKISEEITSKPHTLPNAPRQSPSPHENDPVAPLLR